VNVKTYFQTFQRSRLKRKIFTLNHQRMASPPIQTYTSSPKLSDPVQQYPTPHTEESQKKKNIAWGSSIHEPSETEMESFSKRVYGDRIKIGVMVRVSNVREVEHLCLPSLEGSKM
jgi:hypothetical protein